MVLNASFQPTSNPSRSRGLEGKPALSCPVCDFPMRTFIYLQRHLAEAHGRVSDRGTEWDNVPRGSDQLLDSTQTTNDNSGVSRPPYEEDFTSPTAIATALNDSSSLTPVRQEVSDGSFDSSDQRVADLPENYQRDSSLTPVTHDVDPRTSNDVRETDDTIGDERSSANSRLEVPLTDHVPSYDVSPSYDTVDPPVVFMSKDLYSPNPVPPVFSSNPDADHQYPSTSGINRPATDDDLVSSRSKRRKLDDDQDSNSEQALSRALAEAMAWPHPLDDFDRIYNGRTQPSQILCLFGCRKCDRI